MPIPKNTIPSIIRSAHWVAEKMIKRLGYEFEVRRSGDLKIGLWRKKWKRAKGKNDRLVIIPGFGDSPLSWMLPLSMLAPLIHRNFDEIIFIDFPGYAGFLSRDKAFHSVTLMQSSLFDVLDTLRPKTIFGHSLGGWLASLYAVECGELSRPKQNPARATAGTKNYRGPETIILCNASGVFADEATAEAMQNLFKDAAKNKDMGFKIIRPHVFSKEPFWFSWIQSQYSHFFESAEIEQFIHSAQRSHIIAAERLPSIRAKAWLIWGEHDTMVPPTAIPVWLKTLGPERCEAMLIKNCGHMPQIESPATLVWLLSQVLGQDKIKFPAIDSLTKRLYETVKPA